MTTAMVSLLALAVVVMGMFELRDLRDRRRERLERLNRESWEVLQAARRVNDEAVDALQQMFEEAREQARTKRISEIG